MIESTCVAWRGGAAGLRRLAGMAGAAARYPKTFLGLVALGLCALMAPTARAQSVTWTQHAVAGPSARLNAAMAFDLARGVAVLFGGDDPSFSPLGDTWEWNGSGAGTWSQRSSSGPSARDGVAVTYDSLRGVTVLFGGFSGVDSGETWEWNGTSWAQRLVSGPSPRDGMALAYDSGRAVTVLFGGFASTADSAETWEWNGSAWTQRQVSGPSARDSHTMAYDSARGVTVLFGGSALNVMKGDTWEWNGAGAGSWTQRSSTGPSARIGQAMAYDAGRGVTVLFGGFSGSAFDSDTWEWNGSAWTQRTISGPSERFGAVAAFDAAHGDVLLFGGHGETGPTAETWTLACYANCDGSATQPILNVADFTCFLQKFGIQDPYANCDGSTSPPTLNVADFTCFLQRFAQGCS